MKKFLTDKKSDNLLILFAGWGCDETEFEHLKSEDDEIFNLAAQKEFYKERLKLIPKARHNMFFKITDFEQIFTFDF